MAHIAWLQRTTGATNGHQTQDEIIRWLTGYSQAELAAVLADGTDFERFFGEAPKLNPARTLITGVICGVRIEAIEEPLMREIRFLERCPTITLSPVVPNLTMHSLRRADKRGENELSYTRLSGT